MFFYDIGVAVYAFEGIGMVLPLETKVKDKQRFGRVLSCSMRLGLRVICHLSWGQLVDRSSCTHVIGIFGVSSGVLVFVSNWSFLSFFILLIIQFLFTY